MASRIHGDVYVRFRGRYAETCRRKAVRRCIPSLQTNLQEARPELWQKLEKEYSLPKIENGEYFSFAPVDALIKDNLWICPIKPQHQDNAYYSISRNEIVVPEKEQFKSGEAFYGTLFHEMTHSTGAEGVLDRIKPTTFGSAEYAREELVAELGRRIGCPTLRHDETYKRGQLCLPQRMARRIEGIATIHQDNSVGCEKSGFSDYPKGG